jgi:acetylglutamate kinase
MFMMITRSRRVVLLSILVAAASVAAFAPPAFRTKAPGYQLPDTCMAYKSAGQLQDAAIGVDVDYSSAHLDSRLLVTKKTDTIRKSEPSDVEFVTPDAFEECDIDEGCVNPSMPYPYATMLSASARYIASHVGQTAVFHIPGDLLETDSFPNLIDDIGLSWLLGMKIVVVVDCRSEWEGCAGSGFKHAHECHNTARVIDTDRLRQIEEEAGFVRIEVERKLNKCLRSHLGLSSPAKDDSAASGHVIGGNYYTTKAFGVIQGQDFSHTGYASKVQDENIKNALDHGDIVVLTTIAPSSVGELVSVNGSHLAATVACSLKAHKLIYLSNNSKVLRKKGENASLQDISLSFAESFLRHHKVEVHKSGFAAFEHARQNLDPGAVELLLHLGWASWAVDRGVTRAHIVNPGDGALLEELFTSGQGSNTCLYHDNELLDDPEDTLLDPEFEAFFSRAS